MTDREPDLLGALYVDGELVCARYGRSEGVQFRADQDADAEAADPDGPEFGA